MTGGGEQLCRRGILFIIAVTADLCAINRLYKAQRAFGERSLWRRSTRRPLPPPLDLVLTDLDDVSCFGLSLSFFKTF